MRPLPQRFEFRAAKVMRLGESAKPWGEENGEFIFRGVSSGSKFDTARSSMLMVGTAFA